MASMAVWTDEKVFELISLIHENEFYWNDKHPNYRSKARKKSLLSVISFQLSVPITEVRRKWKNLRTQYLREHKSKAKNFDELVVFGSDNKYIPTWKFYESLTFLENSVQHVKPTHNNNLIDFPVQHSSEACIEQKPSCDIFIEQQLSSNECVQQQLSSNKCVQQQPSSNKCVEQQPCLTLVTADEKETDDDKLNRKRKRKRKRMLEYAEAILRKDEDEFDAFGITVSSKLREMERMQRLHAEKKINDILYLGIMGRLKDDC